MRLVAISIVTLLLRVNAIAQINFEDSTVQVIGYWNNGETQSYVVSLEKYRIKGDDTTSSEIVTQEVDITVRDSTTTSYTVEWLYKNSSVQTDNVLVSKLALLSENLKILIMTDEMGAFVEVVNWEEVRDFMRKGIDLIRKDLSDSSMVDQVVTQMMTMFSSREAIQSVACKEILQYYSFHGARYKLDEVYSATARAPNIFGGEPFDAEVTVVLDEIDSEDHSCILRLWQEVDSEQATVASYEFVRQAALAADLDLPEMKDIPPITIEDRLASMIHCPSGWILYSINTREIVTEGSRSIENRIFEIK